MSSSWIRIVPLLLLFGVGLLFSHKAIALFDEDSPLSLGAGLISQNASRTATNDAGSTSVLGRSLVRIAATYRASFGDSSSDDSSGLRLMLGYTPLGASSADRGEKTKLLNFDAGLYFRFGVFDFHFGPGVLWSTISGEGGTQELDNGASTTVFGLPSGSSTSRIFYLAPGLGARLGSINVDVDVLVVDTLSSRRAVYPMLTLSMGIL